MNILSPESLMYVYKYINIPRGGTTMYRYYQPNKKDIKDNHGDCVIRALTMILDINHGWVYSMI